MEAASDALLINSARDGDHAAYGELFTRYQSRIYNYAYGIAGNSEDASDIAQEAFVRVFEALPRLKGELNFSAYVYRTAHNIAIDAVKGRSHFETPEALDVQAEPSLRADPERVALVQEQQEQAWQAAFRLSDDHRAILTLRELHDLSYQEIAEIMDMPRNTVGVLLSRARLKFKEAFRMSSIDIDKLTAECRDMLPLLSAYIDEELDDKKRARVESHLERCAFCRLALEEMTESSRSYRAILPLLPPAALGEGLWQRLGDLSESVPQNPDPVGTESAASAPDATGGPAETTGIPVDGTGGPADSTAGAGETAGDAVAATDTATPTAAKAGRLLLRPRLALFVLGGIAIVVVATMFATGIFGGGGGSAADDLPAVEASDSKLAAGGVAAASVSTTSTTAAPTTTSSSLGTTSVTTAATTTATTARTTTSTTAAGVAGSRSVDSTAANTAGAGGAAPADSPDPVADDPPTGAAPPDASSDTSDTTAPRVVDTQTPPTPSIVYPAAGETVKGASLPLRWTAVKDPSGVSYRVEVQSLDSKTGGYVTSRRVEGIKGTELAHTMASSVERWRVTAIDGAGNASKPSAWAKFAQVTVGVPTTRLTVTTLPVLDLPLPTLVVPEITTTTTVVLY